MPESPAAATHIHEISQADVAGEPQFAEGAPMVVAALTKVAVVAHNANFDMAFLRDELKAAGWSAPRIASYRTSDASYAYPPKMDRRRIAACCALQSRHPRPMLHRLRRRLQLAATGLMECAYRSGLLTCWRVACGRSSDRRLALLAEVPLMSAVTCRRRDALRRSAPSVMIRRGSAPSQRPVGRRR
ncbi:exonuclease domain-containing protein [Curtobacterium sp. 'Ferrero']|uniref:3'-5' exonuclease n=1 Tax=Curtobacterium sp. 'Ferrero' TaxID=2033654 RepID=UPI0011445AA4